ncbi:MAG: DUF1289 domain-containing protein [Pseudomonadota bacterium]
MGEEEMIEYVPIIESPCVDICVMDGESGWCLGCGRTIDEIASWGMATPELRSAVMAELPARMAELEG